MDRRDDTLGWSVFGAITFLIIMIIIEPLLLFWLGYFCGWLAKLVIGAKLITAINIVFGTAFTADMLPMIGGALGWIGSFFTSSNRSTKKNN